MILYHYTDWRVVEQMCGRSLKNGDRVAFIQGLKRGHASMAGWEWLQPLPANVVWLTSDPVQALFERPPEVRIALAIPSTDRRLVHWHSYLSKHYGVPAVMWDELEAEEPVTRAGRRFYAYFGDVPANRIRGLQEAAAIYPKLNMAA